MLLHKIYHFFKRSDFYSWLKQYSKTQYLNEQELKAMQLNLLKDLLRHAYNSTSYYKELFDKIDFNPELVENLDELKNIPFLTKKTVTDNFQKITAHDIDPKRLISNSTSGSTGTNFHFLTDKKSLLKRSVLNMRMDEWIGFKFGEKKLTIWGAAFDLKKKSFFKKLKFSFKRQKLLSGYNLSESDMMEYFQIMKTFNPKLITGYPSTLKMFSEFLIKNKLNYTPKAIRTEGETLYDFQREIISSAFNAPVYSFYSSREISGIAHECKKQKGFHIFSENVIVEVIDEDGNSISEGEGEIVLTDLNNFVMPFIRYKIGDRAIISQRQCDCGIKLPLLEKIIGRSFDLIKFPNGNQVSGTFWTLLLRSKPGIDDFQVNQKQNGEIDISIKTNDNYNALLENEIIEQIKSFGGSETLLSINKVRDIPITKGGKMRFVISDFKQP